jgi:hypothetical protein
MEQPCRIVVNSKYIDEEVVTKFAVALCLTVNAGSEETNKKTPAALSV